MSVADLKKVNNLRDSVIRIGDRLKVNPLLDAGRKSVRRVTSTGGT